MEKNKGRQEENRNHNEKSKADSVRQQARAWERCGVLSVVYEGSSEAIRVHPPDLSAEGMFINTPQRFLVGAVLKLCFRLAFTGRDITARAEVRHCVPDVGVGVEFIEISSADRKAIERELSRRSTRKSEPPI